MAISQNLQTVTSYSLTITTQPGFLGIKYYVHVQQDV